MQMRPFSASFKPVTNKEKRRLLDKYSDKIFDGNLLASKIRSQLRDRVVAKASSYSTPMLGHIIVGDLAQSELYVKLKLKACDEVGISHRGY